MAALWIAFKALEPSPPPANNSTKAISACATPQVTLTRLLGFNDPNVVCIPNTNVAESAEVTKKEAISNNAMIDKTIPNGIWLNTPNKHRLQEYVKYQQEDYETDILEKREVRRNKEKEE